MVGKCPKYCHQKSEFCVPFEPKWTALRKDTSCDLADTEFVVGSSDQLTVETCAKKCLDDLNDDCFGFRLWSETTDDSPPS